MEAKDGGEESLGEASRQRRKSQPYSTKAWQAEDDRDGIVHIGRSSVQIEIFPCSKGGRLAKIHAMLYQQANHISSNSSVMENFCPFRATGD